MKMCGPGRNNKEIGVSFTGPKIRPGLKRTKTKFTPVSDFERAQIVLVAARGVSCSFLVLLLTYLPVLRAFLFAPHSPHRTLWVPEPPLATPRFLGLARAGRVPSLVFWVGGGGGDNHVVSYWLLSCAEVQGTVTFLLAKAASRLRVAFRHD